MCVCECVCMCACVCVFVCVCTCVCACVCVFSFNLGINYYGVRNLPYLIITLSTWASTLAANSAIDLAKSRGS